MPMYASTGAERLKTPKSRPPIPGTGSGTPKPKPLFPVSGRKSNDTTSPTSTRKKYGQGSRDFDITPDGGSAGREGRHFAVANVGHNGRIYLRYVCMQCSHDDRVSAVDADNNVGQLFARLTSATHNRPSSFP